jgi:transcriptional regulator with XRE-family HTH domain
VNCKPVTFCLQPVGRVRATGTRPPVPRAAPLGTRPAANFAASRRSHGHLTGAGPAAVAALSPCITRTYVPVALAWHLAPSESSIPVQIGLTATKTGKLARSSLVARDGGLAPLRCLSATCPYGPQNRLLRVILCNQRTWGTIVRKRRLDLGLRQKDIARRLETSLFNVWNWERNVTGPSLRFIPRIVRFLGSSPLDTSDLPLGRQILTYRRLHGLRQENLARQLGVDPSTLASWEKGSHKPMGKHRKRLEGLLSVANVGLPPASLNSWQMKRPTVRTNHTIAMDFIQKCIAASLMDGDPQEEGTISWRDAHEKQPLSCEFHSPQGGPTVA